MTSSQSTKKNEASLNVLKTLLVLLEDNYSMRDLVDNLNSAISTSINIFTYSAIIKHNIFFSRI